jgi:hypothetical protein
VFSRVTGSGIMDGGGGGVMGDAIFEAGDAVTFTVTGAQQTWHWGDGSPPDVVASGVPITHTYAVPHTMYVTTLTLTGGPATPVQINVDQSGLISFDVSALTGLTAFAFQYTASPVDVGSVADFSTNTHLTQLVLDYAYFQSVVLSNAGNMTLLEVDHNRLPSSQVDALLVALAGGAISGGRVDLSNQTPAAPPGAAGIAAGLVLVGRGWTVTTD